MNDKFIIKKWYQNTYIRYTCVFLIVLPFIFLPFIQKEKTFVWKIDGIKQHYPILQYYGKILRDILTGNGFKMIDFKIGMGFDTITTLHYYALGDPISLLSIFMNSDNSVLIYNLLILIRFYLIGVSFIALCRYWKKDGNGVILGALIYTFCGFSLYGGVRHPFFLNPMIYLPLMIIGLEQVLNRRKPYLLIIITFISTLSNFYFFYILTIIAVVYVIVRYFGINQKYGEKSFLDFFRTGLRTGGAYVLGTAMASIIFIPIVYAFLNNGRLDSGPELEAGYFRYNLGFYVKIIEGFFAPGEFVGYWTELSFCSITVVSIAVVLGNKRFRKILIAYILTFCALLVPLAGYIMNGFAYTTNRWSFVISLFTALLFTLSYDYIFDLSKLEKRILAGILIGYGILSFFLPIKKIVRIEFFILLITVLVIYLLQLQWLKKRRKVQEIILCIFTFLLIGFHGYSYFAPNLNGYIKEYLSKEEVYKASTSGALSLIENIKDNSNEKMERESINNQTQDTSNNTFYRIETYGDKFLNEALNLGFNDVSGYYSLMDGNITSYFKELDLLNLRTAYRFDNLDNRVVLDSLASVKYLVSTRKNAAPYGFELINQVKKQTSSLYLFENQYYLPLGYMYDSYIRKQDYNKLNSIEKQNVMLDAVVLEDNTKLITKMTKEASNGIKDLSYQLTPDNNVLVKDNRIRVKKAGAKVIVEYEAKPNTETYISFQKLRLTDKYTFMSSIQVKGKKGVMKYLNVRSKYYGSYFGKENFLVNVGYCKIGENKVTLTFKNKTDFTYGSIHIYSLDMAYYQKKIEALNQTSLQNIELTNNHIEGDVISDKDGVMVFSIPYSRGYHAYVDGQETKLQKGNIMYMAIPLKAGNHHIVIKYVTPYLKLGCFLSIGAFLIFIGMIIYQINLEKGELQKKTNKMKKVK